jgi:hypothetical protein
MKFKSIFLTAIATLGLTAETMAQVPNYLPTNGLVGWWPFNGNANDESGNGNNGAVNGATLTSDRYGNAGSAFEFNGTNNWIEIGNVLLSPVYSNHTISLWYKSAQTNTSAIFTDRDLSLNYKYSMFLNNGNTGKFSYGNAGSSTTQYWTSNQNNLNNFIWHNVIVVVNSDSSFIRYYIDGSLDLNINSFSTSAWNPFAAATLIGKSICASGSCQYYLGKIDDIGIWDRALTQQEITVLYNAVNCTNNLTISPQTNSLNIGSTATFTATTLYPNPNYVWQSDFGQGFQTLNNFGNYSDANTATLNIANIQLPNHTQPIRVISSSGNCIDTSDVAIINILDTCITNVTVYDTLLTTVTDTLIINATIIGLNPPSNQNTIKVFPNPANTHITVDYGNFASLNGYTLTIVNSIGQTVFTTAINQQTSYLDLSTWTGTGIYYVQLIDTQNNTIENRKIVIQ